MTVLLKAVLIVLFIFQFLPSAAYADPFVETADGYLMAYSTSEFGRKCHFTDNNTSLEFSCGYDSKGLFIACTSGNTESSHIYWGRYLNFKFIEEPYFSITQYRDVSNGRLFYAINISGKAEIFPYVYENISLISFLLGINSSGDKLNEYVISDNFWHPKGTGPLITVVEGKLAMGFLKQNKFDYRPQSETIYNLYWSPKDQWFGYHEYAINPDD